MLGTAVCFLSFLSCTHFLYPHATSQHTLTDTHTHTHNYVFLVIFNTTQHTRLCSYRLESGEPVHIYRRRKDRVDEIRPAGLPQTSVRAWRE